MLHVGASITFMCLDLIEVISVRSRRRPGSKVARCYFAGEFPNESAGSRSQLRRLLYYYQVNVLFRERGRSGTHCLN